MKELQQLFRIAELLVKRPSEELNYGKVGLREAEQQVVEFVNRVGQQLVERIVEGVSEPVMENELWVEGRRGKYNKKSNLRLITRFGKQLVIGRRYYRLEGGGGYCPLDEKLGVENCGGFTPLMSYLLSCFGASEPYESGAKKLSEVMGFGVSATGVQRTTERTGKQLPHSPYQQIEQEEVQRGSELMVVEIDGTMSPQIHEEPGVRGRASVRQPTEYKECNVVVIEKRGQGGVKRWTGAMYGARKGFEQYVRKAGLQMGQMHAKRVAFVSDGAHSNWEIQRTNFPGAVAVLDFYHAAEHLEKFCEQVEPNPQRRARRFQRWRGMLLAGEHLQVLEEMRGARRGAQDGDAAQKELNYFENNKARIDYGRYQEEGLPIGSGLVEGSCKFVVGKRFKGSGMRWKKEDNESVLEVRLALLNGRLRQHFRPRPQRWRLVA